MKHLKYLKYLIIHKFFVLIECWKRGLFIQGITHDLSKFLPSEWIPYTDYFYGAHFCYTTFSWAGNTFDCCGTIDGTEISFNYAWLKHQHRNPHHFQYWILREDSGNQIFLEMPEKYRNEMVADWIGAGKAKHGKNEAKEWYLKNKQNIALHAKTRTLVERDLGII